MNECIVCTRIPAKLVFRYAHEIFKEESREKIHQLAVEAITIINDIDRKDRIFFCGKSYQRILSGLFYLLAKKHGIKKPMWQIAIAFPSAKSKSNRILEVTVRCSVHWWRDRHPEYFDFKLETGR